jgi:hypothetical protein
VEQAPDKTFIGKISKGWDFLGYHFDGNQLTVAAKTVEKHVLHTRQLYEQLRMKKATSIEMACVLGLYVKRWQRWVAAGLQGIKIGVFYEPIRYRIYLSPSEQRWVVREPKQPCPSRITTMCGLQPKSKIIEFKYKLFYI